VNTPVGIFRFGAMYRKDFSDGFFIVGVDAAFAGCVFLCWPLQRAEAVGTAYSVGRLRVGGLELAGADFPDAAQPSPVAR
jgi:hypothetical protein